MERYKKKANSVYRYREECKYARNPFINARRENDMISIKEAEEIYDGLAIKDLPRQTFIGKLRGLTHQGKMQRDLRELITQMQETRTRQVLAEARARKIEEAIR